jgi:membrane fusion protein (multidrug efflux system)
MKKGVRVLIPVLGVLAVVGVLVAIKVNQIGLLIQTGKAAQEKGPPPETVATRPVQTETWNATLSAVGDVEAERGVTISNDSPGIVTKLNFDSGDKVTSGAVLLELETQVERAQLASTEARLELAGTTLRRTTALKVHGVSTEAEVESANAELKRLHAEVAALRAQIDRKVVRAPFGGEIGIRRVNLGQYLAPGSAITTLQSDKEDYVDFALPQEFLGEIRVGLPVRLVAKQAKLELDGVIAAVDPSLDQRTRSVTIRASTVDPERRLRPGMFVNVSVLLDKTRKVTVVPTTAVLYAAYGDSVFVVEAESKTNTRKVARQQFVRLGETRGDFVEIEKGLTGEETVVVAGAFKLRNGAPITINNEIALDPQLNPQPKNR